MMTESTANKTAISCNAIAAPTGISTFDIKISEKNQHNVASAVAS